MRMIRWTLLLCLALAVSVVSAQDATPAADITLAPYNDELFGIQGVLPDGWTRAAPGVYARGQDTGDVTLLAQQAAPATLDQVVPSLLPQLGLDALPEPTATVETSVFTWTTYKVDVTAAATTIAVDLALAEVDGKTYIVLMQTTPDEYAALHEAVFLPALDAFAPLAEAPPEPNLPYVAEEVTFANGDVTLAGTLTLPEGDGLHPAVVLITGSGPQDRDESLAPLTALKPFKLIADALSRWGIAVLRYDDRGVGESTGDHASATSADFATDAAAAIDYLLTRDDINPDEIGVLGHSEGGLIAAILGASNPDVAFIVSMAGTAVNGRDLLLLQNQKLILAEGGTQEQADQQVAFLNQAFDLLDSNESEAVNDLVYETVLAQVETLPEDQRAALGDIETYAQGQAASLTSDWMRFFLDYNPGDDWAQTTVPVLALFGGKDVQVVAEQNAPALETALEQAGNADYEIVTLPSANHLFQDAETGAVSEYGMLPAEFVDGFLPLVGDWILARVTLPE